MLISMRKIENLKEMKNCNRRIWEQGILSEADLKHKISSTLKIDFQKHKN